MKRISLPIPAELLKAVDAARGDVPRTVWIRRAIETRLALQPKSSRKGTNK
jgi:metal-responsive CopG/Arc/MetJ family transcriptional regulator